MPETGERMPLSGSRGGGHFKRLFRWQSSFCRRRILRCCAAECNPASVRFTGVAAKEKIFKQVHNRLLYFGAAISLFLLFMLWLSLYTARDITVPLEPAW